MMYKGDFLNQEPLKHRLDNHRKNGGKLPLSVLPVVLESVPPQN